jgi:hypothetical protein
VVHNKRATITLALAVIKSTAEPKWRKCRGAVTVLPLFMTTPQPGERFFVNTDTSNVGIREALSQVQDGQERVIAYYSKTLNKAERNKCVTRKKLLGIVRTLEHFH